MTEEKNGASSQEGVRELLDIITEPAGGFVMMPNKDMDEVYPNLYIGDISSAKNIYRLKQMEFTHLINTAQGTSTHHVNLDQDHYKDTTITFMGIEADDDPNYSMDKHWTETSEFIDTALNEDKGKVLVHCREGCSRSATIVLAFLMMKRNLSVQEAMRKVRKHREICPNDGFLQQLLDLNKKLSESSKAEPDDEK